jgi:hypothetical protein
MDFDIKNNLLKSSVGEQRLSKKNVDATIDQSLIASTAQKNLNMEMKDENGNPLDPKNKSKNKNRSQKKDSLLSEDKKKQQTEVKIERDPLKLLKLF